MMYNHFIYLMFLGSLPYMSYFSLRKYATLFISLIALVFGYIIYGNFSGKSINEGIAGSICAKLVYENIDKDFNITKIYYKNFYTLSDSKIELYIIYSNGRQVSNDCIFRRKYKNNRVILKQAFLVNRDGKLIYLDNLEILLLE
jgi:hypothetical protein